MTFDENFEARPAAVTPDRQAWWGGYVVEFKIIAKDKHQHFKADLSSMRRQSHVTGPEQRRIFSIDISKHEFCGHKVKAKLDDYTVYVYSLEMIAIEKFRAICQQMSEYEAVGNKRARGRDFYDVCQILDERAIDFGIPENQELVRLIFDAKNVPLNLLSKIGQYREYHRQDWSSVKATVISELQDYDYYFDRVLRAIDPLITLGEV